ncbi:hypothetical protein EDD11_004592 [Mortierella claussenii]|nr:hypothetical protein EDD11_004592 [Mortierella claussenii]
MYTERQFNEADVDFTVAGTGVRVNEEPLAPSASFSPSMTPPTPPTPLKSRLRTDPAASLTSVKKNLDQDAAAHKLGPANSATKEGPPMSEDHSNITPSGNSTAAGRRQIISFAPALHTEQHTPAPSVPPRSSSRQSKNADLQSLATKSSASSIKSLADTNGSSATITANSLEIRQHDPASDQHRLLPTPRQQSSKPSSRKTSVSSRAASPGPFMSPDSLDEISTTFAANSQDRHSRRQSHESSPLEQEQLEQKLTQEQRRQEHDHYLSSVLEDIRAKTNRVLQKMSPTAGLYADRGSKEVDLRVVQMPVTSHDVENSNSNDMTPSSVSVLTTAPVSAPTSSSANGISFTVSKQEAESESRAAGRMGMFTGNRGRTRSRSVREESRSPQSSTLSDSNGGGIGHSVFGKLRPWADKGSEQRQRSHSGPARHSDSTIQQKWDEFQESGIQQVQSQQETRKVLRQRRPSTATAMTVNSIGTTHSCPPQQALSTEQRTVLASKHRSKNWFGMGRRNSANLAEDTRAPHPLGQGIEGGIVSRHMAAFADEDEDEDDDGDDDTEDEAVAPDGRKSVENSRLFINDYGFIYDLDDDMNQGQDLTGTGSSVGAPGSLGSNISTMSELDRKKEVRKQKHNRENELKWIHAVTRLQSDSVKKSSKYKRLARKGVPASVRGRVWLFLAKADVYRQPGLFEKLCKRGPLPIHEVIERDIHRCYPDHIHFRDGMGGTGQQDLHSILKAYAHYKPSVGYCQGMGRLVGMMLMQMPVEDAFWLLVATIEGYMQDYYTPSLRQLRVDAQVFERLLKDQDPTLAEHLEKNDVIPLMYMTQWFMTLYTMSLPWASVLRVWDVFYFDGVKALFRVGLAILQLCREHLLSKCPTSSELLAYILHIPLENLAPKSLLETALQIKLRKQSVQKLIAVTAESMDAAAADTRKSASQNINPSTTNGSNSHSNSNNTDAQPVLPNTDTQSTSKSLSAPASTNVGSGTQSKSGAIVPSSAPSASGPTSFSPLGVFKTRKRAGTVHK